MTADKITAAIAEAREFIRRATALVQESKIDKYAFFGNKRTGSVRRQSLELTRALAEMRKP